ncbi:MAG: 2-hydroxyacyl-CoA dehydratase family protein [Myxococcota bacterium]|jgi:benzoyl-CoA reductase/2-hydroxyglutaryl-CoA dehydratase subunit BcrC/BadD/HgdB|nr:2-hydroxyacyl-CoA dehydratase family protein [Myxococcota bacterium]
MIRDLLRSSTAAAVGRLVGPAWVRLETLGRQGRRLLRRRAPPASSPLAPPLPATNRLRELLALYRLEGRYGLGGRPVAWATHGAPVELLRAQGFYVVLPEHEGARCGVRRGGGTLARLAEQEGFAPEVCSSARLDLGALVGGSPRGAIPRPDVLVACTNGCNTVLYWFRELARRTGAPLFVLETPFVRGQVRHHARLYVRDQLQGLAERLAGIGGRRLDPDRLSEVLHHSREASAGWRRALEAARARPAPWEAADMFALLAPLVVLRGEPATARGYQQLGAALEARSRAGRGAVPTERLRLLWDGPPIWFRLRHLSRFLAARQVALVGATATAVWAEAAALLDPDRPWLSLADVLLQVHLAADLRTRHQRLATLARDLAADGVIFHADRSCKPSSIGQAELASLLGAEGLRGLLLEADHADERGYVDEEIERQLLDFLETCG